MRRWRSQGRAVKEGRGLGIALCGLLMSLWQSAFAAPASLESVLPRECLALDSAHPVRLPLAAPTDGVLRVMVEERGISTVSDLHDGKMSTVAPTAGAPADSSASPVERFGTVVLTRDVHGGDQSVVEVHVEDSHDISGRVCVAADLIASSDLERINAERDLDAGGRASHATDWTTAFSRYLSAAREFDALGLWQSAAIARHAMAELAYLRFDRKRDAYALASEALADYGASGEPVLIGALAELEAKALMDMPGNDSAAVAPLVRRWLAVARRYEGSDPYGARELPRVDILKGFLEYLLNRDASRDSFTAAARSCRELHDWDCYAMASNNLAALAEQGKDYSAALSEYADALRLLPVELDPKLVATIWNNMGRLQGAVGLFSASERSHTAAMQTYARLGDCQGVRRSLVRAGYLLVHVGNLADGESDLARAASFECPSLLASARAPAAEKTANSSLELDGARRDSGEKGSATLEHPCAQSLDPASLTRESRLIVFNSLLALGNEALLEGNSAEVWRCLDAAQQYKTDSRNQVRLANARGGAFLQRNDPKDARAAFAGGIQISDEAGLPTVDEVRRSAQLGIVKSMLLAGDAAGSLAGAFQALALSTARGDIDNTITSLRLIAAGLRGSGQPEKAVHVLQVAVELIEAVPIDQLDGEQRATFLASQHTVFAELTDLFAAQGSANDSSAWLAFEASERGRARSLRYALTQQTRDAAAPTAAPPTAKYQHLMSDFVAISSSTTNNQPPDALLDAIERLARSEGGGQSGFDRVRLGRTIKQLGATLVEYASGSTEMLAFVITEDHVRIVHLGDSREIARVTAELRDRLRDTEAPASEVREAARAVARLVLWPITPYLRDNRAVVVPDDALNTVPLAVLPWADAPNDELLLQHAETSVIPSALFLMQVHAGASGHSEMPRLELIGDPVFRIADWRRECTEIDTTQTASRSVNRTLSAWTESLPRLPGTRSEVNGIARLAHESRPGSRVETLVGCAAVPSALRRAAGTDVDLLHIATHARIDAQRPRLSALALTPESPQDGPASTFGLLDILGLKLNSKLVVLSACETSRGRLLPGEGVLGPAQAFLQAGSAAVLASYWRVDDQVTSAFMQRFYKYLLVDRLSASAALRKTQLESAAAGKSYEWAAFSLYGWPDSSI